MPEDDLTRAVRARIDAYRPRTVPPLAVITDRRRTRDRRRGLSAAAVSLVAIAGFAFAGPSLINGGQDSLTTTVAGPATPTATVEPSGPVGMTVEQKRYGIVYADLAAYDDGRDRPRIEVCFALPGTSGSNALYSFPPQYSTTVTGSEQIGAFEQCLAGVPNLTVQQTASGPAGPGGPVPIDRIGYALSRDGLDLTVTVPIGGGCQTTGTAVVTAAEKATRVTLRATVTRPAAPSPSPPPPGVEPFCTANLVEQDVTVRLDAPLANRFVIDGRNDKQIVPQQDTPEAFIERCLGTGTGRGQVGPAQEYVGATEADIDRMIAGTGPPIRVIGRNGECLDRLDDLQTDRINVLIANGEVIWAGRF